MNDPTLTDRILCQGGTLVLAIEALDTIEPSSPSKRALTQPLLAAIGIEASGRLKSLRKAVERLFEPLAA
jgi:hypothetical protein